MLAIVCQPCVHDVGGVTFAAHGPSTHASQPSIKSAKVQMADDRVGVGREPLAAATAAGAEGEGWASEPSRRDPEAIDPARQRGALRSLSLLTVTCRARAQEKAPWVGYEERKVGTAPASPEAGRGCTITKDGGPTRPRAG